MERVLEFIEECNRNGWGWELSRVRDALVGDSDVPSALQPGDEFVAAVYMDGTTVYSEDGDLGRAIQRSLHVARKTHEEGL